MAPGLTERNVGRPRYYERGGVRSARTLELALRRETATRDQRQPRAVAVADLIECVAAFYNRSPRRFALGDGSPRQFTPDLSTTQRKRKLAAPSRFVWLAKSRMQSTFRESPVRIFAIISSSRGSPGKDAS